MKHTITKTEQGYVCQAVNPYDTDDAVQRFLFDDFSKNSPAYHFVHPNPLPDNSIVDGEDLGEPFSQYRRELNRMPLEDDWFNERYIGHEYPLISRMAISFKHPKLMACIDGVFIRKEQIKNTRLEERRKEISQGAKDRVDCHAPYQELSLYMYNDHGTILLQQDIHEIIEIVGRIEQPDEQRSKDDLISRTELIKRLGLDLESLPVNSDYADAQSDGIIRAINVAKKMTCLAESSEQKYKEALEKLKLLLPKEALSLTAKTMKAIINEALNPKI